jgi:hypothetical protein
MCSDEKAINKAWDNGKIPQKEWRTGVFMDDVAGMKDSLQTDR